MTLLEHDDDRAAERVRAALRTIVAEDLAALSMPRELVTAPGSGRTWTRPATLVAAAVLVIAMAALVLALLPDHDRSVVVDGGAVPVRIIPAPLPEDMRVGNVVDVDRPRLLADDRQVPQAAWVAPRVGRITSMLQLRLAWDVPDDGTVNANVFTTSVPECSGTTIYLVGFGVGDDLLQTIGTSISCAIVDGRPRAAASPPEGFVPIDPTSIVPQHWTAILLDGRPEPTYISIAPYDVSFDDAMLGAGWRQERIGDTDVLVREHDTEYDTEYRWAVVDDVWVDLTRGALTDDEIAALVAGTGVATEAEWQAWRAAVQPQPDPGSTATTAAPIGATQATTVPPR